MREQSKYYLLSNANNLASNDLFNCDNSFTAEQRVTNRSLYLTPYGIYFVSVVAIGSSIVSILPPDKIKDMSVFISCCAITPRSLCVISVPSNVFTLSYS